jgi:hypothetical protein
MTTTQKPPSSLNSFRLLVFFLSEDTCNKVLSEYGHINVTQCLHDFIYILHLLIDTSSHSKMYPFMLVCFEVG